ncbi:glutathione S-transferase N-terminal domain-containing protein [Candidatus Micrarchaeota archaeon]|nr:glutathione S-transferase N-terminal domain-containing protein [Candidatus Micrarchaeota archaeon]
MEIIVYSTTSCPYCNNLKTYLKQKKIEFTDYDISKDREKAIEMIKKSRQKAVPVIDIDGIIIVGFDVPRIEKALTGLRIDRDSGIRNLIFDPFDQ